MGCQVWGSTVCSCHCSVGLFLFPCWPMEEDGPWGRQQPLGQSPKMWGRSAWPLLLFLLHPTLCMNPVFQHMNSVFQCKNPLFRGFMNPILWYVFQGVGFSSTRASGRSDAFALSGSSPELLPDTAVFAQQLQAAFPQDAPSPLPLLLLPSQGGTLGSQPAKGTSKCSQAWLWCPFVCHCCSLLPSAFNSRGSNELGQRSMLCSEPGFILTCSKCCRRYNFFFFFFFNY